jgi:DNA-binding transcriptional regulator YdaS (Cro superfamily)
MNKLASYIDQTAQRPLQAWAAEFGISRPHLHALVSGARQPSIQVAAKIQAATRGRVMVTDWPNLAAVIDAAQVQP